MTCHQLQSSIPSSIQTWSKWAENVQQPEELCSNRFGEINVRLSRIRADLKLRGITSAHIIITELLPIDEMLNHWRHNLPQAWYYQTFHTGVKSGSSAKVWQSRCDIYADFWLATVWNGFRSVRMVIHEAIIKAIVTARATEHQDQLQISIAALKDTVDEVCASVPYLLGHYQRDEKGGITPTTEEPQSVALPLPGGWVLVWPLFQAAMLRTTSQPQRDWIASVLRHIGLTMGLKLAISMAEVLAKHDTILADGDTWLTGDFTALR